MLFLLTPQLLEKLMNNFWSYNFTVGSQMEELVMDLQ